MEVVCLRFVLGRGGVYVRFVLGKGGVYVRFVPRGDATQGCGGGGFRMAAGEDTRGSAPAG